VTDSNTIDATPRQMRGLELLLSLAQRRLVRLGRKLPRLVWYDDELDVTVTFKAATLPEGLSIEESVRELWSGPVHDLEVSMARLGIAFDKGMGPAGRDWEWDWSLRGPISVRFRRRAKKPELRCPKRATGEG